MMTYKNGIAPALTAALTLTLVAGCAGRQETVVQTTRTTTAIQEQTIATPKTIDISIVDLHDEPASDPAQEKVVGTIINQGDRPVSGVSIRVNALDGGGRVIKTVQTPPLAQTIDAHGGRATFEALMPRDEAVRGYHAVAIAR